MNRALAYQSKGEIDCTIADFTKAIALNPDDANAYCGRGDAYQSKGDYDCTIEDFTKAIARNPDDANAYFGRAYAYQSKGDYDIADLTKAIALQMMPFSISTVGLSIFAKAIMTVLLQTLPKIALNPDDAAIFYIHRG